MTDRQARRWRWAMKNSTWFLALRPTHQAAQQHSRRSRRCTRSSAAAASGKAAAQIAGDFPESTRWPVTGTSHQPPRPPERPRGRPGRGVARARAGDLLIRPAAEGAPRAAADVAVPRRSSRRRRRASPTTSAALRELSTLPLILAAYGEPNGIVETGLAVGAADVLVLPQPAETLLFALRKAATGDRRRRRPARSSRSSRRRAAPARRCLATNLAVAAATLRHADAARRPRPPVRRRGAHARRSRRERRCRPRRLERRHRRREAQGVRHAPTPHGARPPAGAAAARRRPSWSARAELAGVLGAAARRYDAIVVDTGAALRRPDAGGARPQRPAAARLHPRRAVAQERPPRPRDARPARLPARPVSHRRNRVGAAGGSRAGRRAALDAQDRLRAARRPGRAERSTGRRPRRARRASDQPFARAVGARRVRRRSSARLAPVERSQQPRQLASSCGAGDERDRAATDLDAAATRRCSPSGSAGRPEYGRGTRPSIRTPS